LVDHYCCTQNLRVRLFRVSCLQSCWRFANCSFAALYPSTSMPRRSISYEVRLQILNLRDRRLSEREIAETLNLPRSSINAVITKFIQHGSVADRPRVGRPPVIGAGICLFILRQVNSGAFSTTTQLSQAVFDTYQQRVSKSTIRRLLIHEGYRCYVKQKRPQLEPRHERERKTFARNHLDWGVEEWQNVVFSDECKLLVIDSSGRDYCWKKPGTRLLRHQVTPTRKFGGGSIMVWGCMTFQGVGYLTKIEGGLDAALERDILRDELTATLEYYRLDRSKIIFQHDNDPKHTAKVTQKWLREHQISVLSWPPCSPDMNPIEHLWSEVKRRLRIHPRTPRTLSELWETVQTIWNSIPASFCEKLYRSMPDRIAELHCVKGWHTGY